MNNGIWMGTAFRKAYVLTRPVQAQHTKGLTWSQKWQCGDSKDFNKNSWNKMDFFLFFFLLFFSFNLNYITLNVCLKHQLRFCVYRLFQVTLDNSSASLLNFHCMKLQKVCLFLFLSFFFFSFLFFFFNGCCKIKKIQKWSGAWSNALSKVHYKDENKCKW